MIRGRKTAMMKIETGIRTRHRPRPFALASLDEIYTDEALNDALRFEATHLESGVLVNEGITNGTVHFTYQPLPRLAQASPGYGVVSCDFDGDGAMDVYTVQNFFGREPETGRWDGGLSLMMLGDGQGNLTPSPTARFKPQRIVERFVGVDFVKRCQGKRSIRGQLLPNERHRAGAATSPSYRQKSNVGWLGFDDRHCSIALEITVIKIHGLGR